MRAIDLRGVPVEKLRRHRARRQPLEPMKRFAPAPRMIKVGTERYYATWSYANPLYIDVTMFKKEDKA